MKITALVPVGAKLMKKGMIYSPAHGEISFDAINSYFMQQYMNYKQ